MRPGGVDPLSRQDNVSNDLLRCRPVLTPSATPNHLQTHVPHSRTLTRFALLHTTTTQGGGLPFTPLHPSSPIHPSHQPHSVLTLVCLNKYITGLLNSACLEGASFPSSQHRWRGAGDGNSSHVCSLATIVVFARASAVLTLAFTHSPCGVAWLSDCPTRILEHRGYPGRVGGISHRQRVCS